LVALEVLVEHPERSKLLLEIGARPPVLDLDVDSLLCLGLEGFLD
jgi:hypothetical protein